MAINISSPNGTSSVEQRILVAPQSLTNEWQDCILAGGVAISDAATITDSTTLDSSGTALRVIIDCRVGNTILLRLKYPSDLTVTTPPTVASFGLDQAPGPGAPFLNYVLQPLYSADGNLSETLSVSSRDTTATIDGVSWKFTVTDPLVHAWDRLGSPFAVVGMNVALDGTAGASGLDATAAVIQYKVI